MKVLGMYQIQNIKATNEEVAGHLRKISSLSNRRPKKDCIRLYGRSGREFDNKYE